MKIKQSRVTEHDYIRVKINLDLQMKEGPCLSAICPETRDDKNKPAKICGKRLPRKTDN